MAEPEIGKPEAAAANREALGLELSAEEIDAQMQMTPDERRDAIAQQRKGTK